MADQKSSPATQRSAVTTRDTVAAYKLADMRRVFQFIEADDLVALDKLMLSGRAFHLTRLRYHDCITDQKYSTRSVASSI